MGGNATWSADAAREALNATREDRADMPSLTNLMDMYECGLEFIENENEPADGPDRDMMAALLDQIEAMIATEANEDTVEAARKLIRAARVAETGNELRYAVAPVTHIDVRDPSSTDDNTWTMSGYAAVFNEPTTLYDGKFLKLTESIDTKAFDPMLRDQPLTEPSGVVHFNLNHDMNTAVAATDVPPGRPGSLLLSADKRGLYFQAKVPRDDPDGVRMAAKMRSGVLRQASFAFTVKAAKYQITETDDGPDEEHRTITEIGKLFDVCATPQGAYSQTVSHLRSYAAAIGQPIEPEEKPRRTGGQPHQPDVGGASAVSPKGGDADEETEEETAQREAEQQAEKREREKRERLAALATRGQRLLADAPPRSYT